MNNYLKHRYLESVTGTLVNVLAYILTLVITSVAGDNYRGFRYFQLYLKAAFLKARSLCEHSWQQRTLPNPSAKNTHIYTARFQVLNEKTIIIPITHTHSPQTKQDRDWRKNGSSLQSSARARGSRGSHCSTERLADTYREVAFTGFISTAWPGAPLRCAKVC